MRKKKSLFGQFSSWNLYFCETISFFLFLEITKIVYILDSKGKTGRASKNNAFYLSDVRSIFFEIDQSGERIPFATVKKVLFCKHFLNVDT